MLDRGRWKFRTIVSRDFLGSRLLLENYIIRSKRDPRLCVLGPHVTAGSKPTRIVQCSGLEVQVWNVALIVEPLVIDARPASDKSSNANFGHDRREQNEPVGSPLFQSRHFQKQQPFQRRFRIAAGKSCSGKPKS